MFFIALFLIFLLLAPLLISINSSTGYINRLERKRLAMNAERHTDLIDSL